MQRRVLATTDFRIPQLATADFRGAHVLDVASHGKHMFMRLDKQGRRITPHSHFMMDGSWHIYPRGQRWRGGPAHTIRAVLRTDAHDIIGYRLPVLELLDSAGEAGLVAHLGPDIMAELWSPADAATAADSVSAEASRLIGDALLDQRLVAGIGNLYRCEVLFLHRTTPWTPVERVNVGAILGSAAALMQRNRWQPRQVTTGDGRPGREHFVHGRGGRPCRRCSSAIKVGTTGAAPHTRLAYWCPTCQEGPGPEPDG